MDINSITQPIFGNWYIEEEIGSGAFGTVYKIKREDFGNTYYSALKVIQIPQSKSELQSLRSEFDDDQSLSDYYSNFVQDFAKEIEVMAELKGNSYIVSFEDHAFIRSDDGIGWTILIRMELLTPFVQYQSENIIDNQEIVKLGIDICSALELCEKLNIIHRDIKPDNIFVSKNGDYELGDFGIARELEKTTGGLSKKGTYSYMAPEVYLGKPYNNTVDIYSLGIVMYKLLNHNRAPFMPEYPKPITFTDRENALKSRMGGEAMPDINDIPKVLNDIVKKACAYDPKDRYSSATDMKAALIKALEADAPTAKRDQTVLPTAEHKQTIPTAEYNQTAPTAKHYQTVTTPEKIDEIENGDKTVGPYMEFKREQRYGENGIWEEHNAGQSVSKDKKGKSSIIIIAVVASLIIIGVIFAVLLKSGSSSRHYESAYDNEQPATTSTAEPGESTSPIEDSPSPLEVAKQYSNAAVEYNGHAYAIFSYKKEKLIDYYDCEEFCEERGGHLAVIESQEENDFLFKFMRDSGLHVAFFGYTDLEEEGNWKWVNGSDSQYENWSYGQPNNGANNDSLANEDYAEFFKNTEDGTWNDSIFGKNTYHFFCEWE